MEAWANFFVATAGVGAALAGLVIVAVSVNLQQFVKHPQLPPRASATVSNLMLMVTTSLMALIPQPWSAFAIEIVIFTSVGWAIMIACSREIIGHHMKGGRPAIELLFGLPGGHVAALCLVVGAVLLYGANSHGLYWIAAAALLTLVATAMNVWVFLIEILR